MKRLFFVCTVLLSFASAEPSYSNPAKKCAQYLHSVLARSQSKIKEARRNAQRLRFEELMDELKALRTKKISDFLEARAEVSLANGQKALRRSLSEESREKFLKEFKRLTDLEARVKGFEIEGFSKWWDENQKFYLETGMLNDFAKADRSLNEFFDLTTDTYIATQAKLLGPGWAKRTAKKFKKKYIYGAGYLVLGVTLVMFNKLKEIFVFTVGMNHINAFFAQLFNPSAKVVEQWGTQAFGGVAEDLNSWLNSKKEVISHHEEMEELLRDLKHYGFEEMEPDEANAVFQDFFERLYSLYIQHQKVLPSHLRSARRYFYDMVLYTPIDMGRTLSIFEQQYSDRKKDYERYLRLEATRRLSDKERAEKEYALDMMTAAEAGIAETLAAWKMTEFLYPEVARTATTEAQRRAFQDGFLRFSRSMRYELYVKHFIGKVEKLLDRMEVLYDLQDSFYRIDELSPEQEDEIRELLRNSPMRND